MSITKFESVKHLLGYYKPSSRLLRMANGTTVGALAVWEGIMEIGGVKTHSSFEVVDSKDSWEFLFGKPLLTAFKAIHDYSKDTVTVKNEKKTVTLENQITGNSKYNNKNQPKKEAPESDTTRNRDNTPKEVFPNSDENGTDPTHADNPEDNKTKPAYVVTDDIDIDNTNLSEIKVENLKENKTIFTRLTDPWKKERVEEILRQVAVRLDLSKEQRRQVFTFLSKWADIFALSVSEVKQVDGAVHRLDIPHGAMFSTKVNQKPLTAPQKKYLYKSIDSMLEAGIIEQCRPEQVKYVSPTTLAQKTHTRTGLNLEELQHRVNNECLAHGCEPCFSLPPRTSPTPNDEIAKGEPKWRICQNFAQINKVTKVAPMPQGDIRAKQRRLSGHRWVVFES